MTANHRARSLAISAVLCLVSLLGNPHLMSISSAVAAEPPAEWDGLARVKSKRLANLYILPGAKFSAYKRIRLDPVEVAFDKNWRPNDSAVGPSEWLTKDDLERIKSTLASEFRKVFSEELARSGYSLVDENAEDVLRVSAAIINLYVTAPDKPTAGRSRTYVTDSGHMTLVAELRDSPTGQLLARAVDSVQGRQTGRLQWSSSVANIGDAREALTKWANILRTGLDDAKSHSATESQATATN